MTSTGQLKFGIGVMVLFAATAFAQDVSPEVQALYAQAQGAQAAHRDEAAVADYEKILKLAPDLAPAYNNLGRLLYNLGRFPEAVTTLDKGLSLAPDMHPAQVMLGASHLELGQLNEALPPLEAGVQAMPDDRFARLSLARTLIGLNRNQEAVPQLEAVLQADPKDQKAWYLLGKLHLQLSQEAFEQVQTIDPAAPLAHELSGEIMESMQNTPGAVDAYKQAIAAAPAGSDSDAGPLEHLANLYWSTGDWAHARDAYTNLLGKQPGNCTAHWKLADSLDELAEPPDAGLKEINTALGQCPALVQAHAERARLLLRLGKPADALPDLELAEKAAPDEASVQRLFAQAYRALGDSARAGAANARFQELEKAQRAVQEHHATRVVEANQ